MSMLDGVWRALDRIAAPVFGHHRVRDYLLAPQIRNAPRLAAALPILRTRAGQSDADAPTPTSVDTVLSDDSPVFVLSAGWGSGSTLVQRLAISSGQVLVWGEPFDQATPVHRLAEMVMPVREDWPPEAHFVDDHSVSTLSEAWVANLAPPIAHYVEAHRRYFDGWLGEPARAAGYPRWGLKEVRLTIDHARYLKTLYPQARFVFVYRDLYKSYLSCRNKPWLSVWPDHRATRIASFAHHWRFLLEGFLGGYQDVGGLLLRYEDLIGGQYDFGQLADYLGLDSIDEALLARPVGGRSANRHPLIVPEKLVLDAVGGELRSSLGYRR